MKGAEMKYPIVPRAVVRSAILYQEWWHEVPCCTKGGGMKCHVVTRKKGGGLKGHVGTRAMA